MFSSTFVNGEKCAPAALVPPKTSHPMTLITAAAPMTIPAISPGENSFFFESGCGGSEVFLVDVLVVSDSTAIGTTVVVES